MSSFSRKKAQKTQELPRTPALYACASLRLFAASTGGRELCQKNRVFRMRNRQFRKFRQSLVRFLFA
jgi:hypothetical protein